MSKYHTLLLAALYSTAALGQTRTVEPFRFHSYRQDVCHLGGGELKDVLQGQHLNTLLFENENFLIPTKDGTIDPANPSINVQLMDELALRAGFTWREYYNITKVDPGARVVDELLQWAVDNYDIVAGWWTHSVRRMDEKITFMEGWLDSSIILVGKKVNQNNKVDDDDAKFNLFSPFSPVVWFLIVLTMLASGLVLHFLEYDMFRADYSDVQSKGTRVSGKSTSGSNRRAIQFLRFTVFVWGLFIVAAYISSLTSYFVIHNMPTTTAINSIDDAIKANLRMCVRKGFNEEGYVSEHYDHARIIKMDTIDESEVYKGLYDGRCDLVITTVATWNQYEFQSNINVGCELTTFGGVVTFADAGFALKGDGGKCTSLIRDALNLHMKDLIDEGLVEAIWREHLRNVHDMECVEKERVKDLQLGLKELGGTFILYSVMTVTAICVAMFCACQDKTKRSGGASRCDRTLDDLSECEIKFESRFRDYPTQEAYLASLSYLQQQRESPMGDDLLYNGRPEVPRSTEDPPTPSSSEQNPDVTDATREEKSQDVENLTKDVDTIKAIINDFSSYLQKKESTSTGADRIRNFSSYLQANDWKDVRENSIIPLTKAHGADDMSIRTIHD